VSSYGEDRKETEKKARRATMEKKIALEFSKGGKFTAVLLVKEAPQTCEALLKDLPTSVSCRQGRFGGEEFYFQTNVLCNEENQVPPQWGDISFNCDKNWKAVCIYYGSKIAKKSSPYNLFARIVSDNLDELRTVGERIWLRGEETARIRLL
jgi:hypothetical protein